jgi:hypothetical protein
MLWSLWTYARSFVRDRERARDQAV